MGVFLYLFQIVTDHSSPQNNSCIIEIERNLGGKPLKKVRWGILSTANIAQTQVIPAIIRANNAEVKAIATQSDVTKAHRIAKTFDIEKVYDNYEALLLDKDIDALYIPLPNHLHKEWVIKAAEHGKHILCEKPAALSVDDYKEMADVCKQHGVYFMEAFMYYFHPQHDRVRAMIQAGEIGDVHYMESGFSFFLDHADRGSNIRMNREKGGGSIYDIGCYAIHAIRNVLGSEPTTVQVFGEVDAVSGVDTDIVTYLTMENGVRATFDSSFNLPMRHEYRILGTEGTITVPRAFRPDLHGGEGKIVVDKPGSTYTEYVQGDQYCLEVEHVSSAILGETSLLKLDTTNTLDNLRVIEACYASLEGNQQIKI